MCVEAGQGIVKVGMDGINGNMVFNRPFYYSAYPMACVNAFKPFEYDGMVRYNQVAVAIDCLVNRRFQTVQREQRARAF